MGLLLDVIQGKEVPHTPVWLMRQAGRYMPEYRELRSKRTFLEMCYDPKVACEITMQPINAFDLDAAILFNDILPILEPLGFDLEFAKGEGPLIHNPFRSSADISRLQTFDVKEKLGFAGDAVSLIRKELPKEKDLIGFAGAPFTVASYAIEGSSSKNYSLIKGLAYTDPKAYHALLSAITESTKQYLKMQCDAGADMVQLFDSWGGILDPQDYMKFAHPYSQEIISYIKKETGKPVIHFVKGAYGYFEQVADSEADVLGVDWTVSLKKASEACGHSKVLQGNLDPISLLGSQDILEEKIARIVEDAKGTKGHIFNLGHGIIPQTPMENVRYAVDAIHRLSKR